VDEEFFFPQNVQASYRLWLMGPKHLRRLVLAPVLAIVLGWVTAGLSLYLAAFLAIFSASVYTACFCVPVVAEEQTLWEVWLALRHHSRSQVRFRPGGGGDACSMYGSGSGGPIRFR
jgi:hypothetical protein